MILTMHGICKGWLLKTIRVSDKQPKRQYEEDMLVEEDDRMIDELEDDGGNTKEEGKEADGELSNASSEN
ncbi:hypothetical protein L873DRAFT_1335803 [Choiromyces venosus 120613-1]|uniref:Uncharacterized protein n=1 Tax=Choiromyces venosus 120613-1 TaxID=1336337 RepID=A0A3N4JE75_9PEZI|nr:hypothetical protein L873DRAFT_1335803 [Choiromyces venosus 120613-1]